LKILKVPDLLLQVFFHCSTTFPLSSMCIRSRFPTFVFRSPFFYIPSSVYVSEKKTRLLSNGHIIISRTNQ
jgi:hypothetical protein